MRIALDTNVLAYAEGLNGAERRQAGLKLLRRLPATSVVVPAQVLGEFFNVLVRTGHWPRGEARAALQGWRDAFPVAETSLQVITAAADLATDHELGVWDSVILAAASQSGCRLLLSEDLQDGFTWAGATVVDPFARPRHPMLQALVEPDDA